MWLTGLGTTNKEKYRIRITGFLLYGLLSTILLTHSALADDEVLLQSFEPNTIGFTNDNNDVVYMDFKISLMYPIAHQGKYNPESPDDDILFFSFTGRFGQYIGTRESSPVIGKRFNPKLFFRRFLGGPYRYFDYGYAHESNGQSINSEAAYNDLIAGISAPGGDDDVRFANDAISRGWDFLDFIYKQGGSDNLSAFYLNLKVFLNDGLLQGQAEEANSWEPGKMIQRKNVDGISILYWSEKPVAGIKRYSITYNTGYKDTFDYNSLRFEIVNDISIFGTKVPLMLWVSSGYNSDLVDYNKRVKSAGLAFELTTFD